jgi:hypothetical protein
MARNGVGNFKYYVGISSLAQIATREDRVCVLNILGGRVERSHPSGARLFEGQCRVRHFAWAPRASTANSDR